MSAKTKNIITWILAVILAFAFIGAGFTKLLGVDTQIKNFESWGYPLWLRFPIGLIEIALAIGLVIPRYRKITIYGIFIWTIVAVITHLQAGQASMIDGPIFLGVFAAAILFLSGEKKTRHDVQENRILS
jgi:putative oxidoreductase